MTKENLNYYEKALADFDNFCDEFENAANKRFQGIDDDSRQPIDNSEVERVTPDAAQEIEQLGGEGEEFRTPTIDVQAAILGRIPDSGEDS
tara:strand:+ start:1534 stop:1806 length:273 start_codon:yes stop_codon:yes gene_type:complete